MDSPAILTPRFEDQETARRLAAVAAIRDEVLDHAGLASWLLNWLRELYPHGLRERYGRLEAPSALEEIGR